MSKPSRKLPLLTDTSLRRLRMTPSYIFLIWRWSTWLYALIIIVTFRPPFITPDLTNRGIFLLVVTFVQSLIGTLYAPVFQFLLPRLPRIGVDHLPGRLPQAAKTRAAIARQTENAASIHRRNFNILVYVLDVIICGLVVYYSGPLGGSPFFGDGSPFYRYGMSVALASAFAYGYPGALAASIAYDLFIAFAVFVPAPGSPVGYIPNSVDIFGSFMDTPLIAIIAAYLASLLANYARSRQREQDNVRRQRALVHVGETLIRGAGSQPGSIQHLVQQSVSQLRQGGHFQRLFIAVAETSSDEPRFLTCVASDVMKDTQALTEKVEENELLTHVLNTGDSYISFTPSETLSDYGTAYLYLPFFKDGQVHLVLGAESVRQTPFGEKQKEFLTIAGAQLLVALDNIRLTEQTIDLAASAERGRIAREIHDGVAQLVYMMSLNVETCAAQAHRIAEASDEDAELVTPLAMRLDTLVSISKQALWETRNYMFNLKPLMSGDMSLTQMLTNQIREFETISGLPTLLIVKDDEESIAESTHHTRRYA
ncbi:MAG TPA: hypothetical protein DHW02_15470, partial [Ktedonobacter sp.]|nr:hypothetical protein [Ktedonobacter sp.]